MTNQTTQQTDQPAQALRDEIIDAKFNYDTIRKHFPTFNDMIVEKFFMVFKLHVAEVQRGIGFDGNDETLFDDYAYNCPSETIISDMVEFYNNNFKR